MSKRMGPILVPSLVVLVLMVILASVVIPQGAMKAFADVTIRVAGGNATRYEVLDFPAGTNVTRQANSTAGIVSFTSTGTTATITAGTINGATIGATSGTTGNFTTLKGTAVTGTTVATTGNITSSAGDISLTTAGKGIAMTAANSTRYLWYPANDGSVSYVAL
jgi:hypothetical protein